MALSAVALGLQANAIRDLHVPGISTTAFTATFIGLFSGLAAWSLTARAPVRTGRASGRNGLRHRDRLGRPKAARYLRPGR
jgi:hypothetical protein